MFRARGDQGFGDGGGGDVRFGAEAGAEADAAADGEFAAEIEADINPGTDAEVESDTALEVDAEIEADADTEMTAEVESAAALEADLRPGAQSGHDVDSSAGDSEGDSDADAIADVDADLDGEVAGAGVRAESLGGSVPEVRLKPLQAQASAAESAAFVREWAGSSAVRRVCPVRPAPEVRPGQLTSVIRLGGITAYPPPMFDPPATAAPVVATRKPDGRLRGVSGAERDAARFGGSVGVVAYGLRDVVPVRTVVEGAEARPAGSVSAAEPGSGSGSPAADGLGLRVHGEIRALVAVLVEVMAGRRPADQVSACLHSGVRVALGEWLRGPARGRYSRAAVLRRVRLSGNVGAVEAMALVQDGPRMRAVAFRFDAVAERGGGRAGAGRPGDGRPRWLCTALQAA